MEKANQMRRPFELLSAVRDYLSPSCESCNSETKNTSTSYEYRCPKCGLVLGFNRNQPGAECPNDGTRMMRIG